MSGDGVDLDPRRGGIALRVADALPAVPNSEPGAGPETPSHAARLMGSPGARVLGVYAAVRIALLVADVLSAHVSYGSNLPGPLHSWDSSWYLAIAVHGYPLVAPRVGGTLSYSAAGFMPVFPLLIRLFTIFYLSPVAAALVVSVLAGAVGTLIVLRLGTELADQATGWNAAVLFTLFPGMGISWGLLYCECVGLALTAGSLLFMVRRRWIWAGVRGVFATATSPLALPLALAAAVPAVQALRNREAPRRCGPFSSRRADLSPSSSSSQRAITIFFSGGTYSTRAGSVGRLWTVTSRPSRSPVARRVPGSRLVGMDGTGSRSGRGGGALAGQTPRLHQRLLPRCRLGALRVQQPRVQAAPAYMGVPGPHCGGEGHTPAHLDGDRRRLRVPPAAGVSRVHDARQYDGSAVNLRASRAASCLPAAGITFPHRGRNRVQP